MSEVTNNLKFTKSVSLNRFKAVQGITKINIVKNPKTDKTFFTCPEDSDIRGTIASSTDFSKEIMVSTMVDSETGNSFLMLHNPGNSSANVIQTL